MIVEIYFMPLLIQLVAEMDKDSEFNFSYIQKECCLRNERPPHA